MKEEVKNISEGILKGGDFFEIEEVSSDPPGFRHLEPNWPCCGTCIRLKGGQSSSSDPFHFCGKYVHSEEPRFYSERDALEELNYDRSVLLEEGRWNHVCDDYEGV